MPFAHALLLYIYAAGVGEALLAGPGAHAPAALQSPHAVLPGYQIVLAFPATTGSESGDFQFSTQPSPFRSALFSVPAPPPPAFHPALPSYPAAPAQPAFLAPDPSVDVDNYLDTEDRPVTYSNVRTHQQPFRPRQFGHRDGSNLINYSETTNINAYPPQYDSPSLESVGRFGSSRNLPASRVAQTVTSIEDGRLPSRHADVQYPGRHFKASPREPTEFRGSRPHQSVADESQPSQQRVTDIPNPQQRGIMKSSVNQYVQPYYPRNGRYSPRSQTAARFNTFSYDLSDLIRNNPQFTPEFQGQIQQHEYSNHRSNEYNSNSDEIFAPVYHQSNVPSLPFNKDLATYSPPTTEEQARVALPKAQSQQDQHQLYQVDVESNGYGYRYAVQSNLNHN